MLVFISRLTTPGAGAGGYDPSHMHGTYSGSMGRARW